MSKSIYYIAIIIFLMSCTKSDPNQNAQGEDILISHQIFLDSIETSFKDTVYIPIYSDIYSKTISNKYNLTATLSIRNTSLFDSIYIEVIDYYNTKGDLVRSYLKKAISLKPLETIEYVIEEEDTEGGTGANFIVNWGSNAPGVKPIFQGVMVSVLGQKSFAFTTHGTSISRHAKTKATSPPLPADR